MKVGTIVALVFIALACIQCSSTGPPEHVVSPLTFNQTFVGSSFSLGPGTEPKTSMAIQSMVARGGGGVAFVDSLIVFEDFPENAKAKMLSEGKDSRCTNEQYPIATNLVSATWVQVYRDGSAFTGAVPKAELEKFALCTDGVDFHLKIEGKILSGGGRRFENLKGGTWSADGTIQNFRMTGEFKGNFEYDQP